MDGGAWKAVVHVVAKSRTRLSDFTFIFPFHALDKEMATRSRVLAWRIPGTGEPGGLPSMGSHRVGHDWSDLAAATAWAATCTNLGKKEKFAKENEMKISYLLNVPCIFYIALLKWGIICLPVILSLSQCFWSLFSFSKSCRNTNDSGNCIETGDSLHGHLPTRRLSSFQAVKRIIKMLACL